MSQLKKLNNWIVAYETANDIFPDSKAIKFKIKELLKEEVIDKKSGSKKIYFRDCKWSDYNILRKELASDQNFVKQYSGVDLKAYIEDAMAWSEKGNTTTENGWKLTLKNWMRKSKLEGRLIMKPKADIKDAFTNQ
jgi:ribonuclease HII